MANKEITTQQKQFFKNWESIVYHTYFGGTCYTEWNNELNIVQVKRNVPHSHLCIDISIGIKGNSFSIDLVDLSKTDYLEYYLKGREFHNTFEQGVQAIDYLYELIKEL
jgi:hypothetical protein